MEINESISIMKALADSSRLMILNSLMQKPQYVEELSERLKLAVSTVSFHLKKLETAKLVYKVKEQYYLVFHINEEIFCYTLKELTSFENIHKAVQDERIVQYRQKVIDTYFNYGKLTRIPSQHKKRLLILNEIIRKFEPGRVYPEKEVDEIIKTAFDDYCSIRRYFIDERMMDRDKGRYWLNSKYVKEQFTEDSSLQEKQDGKMKTAVEIRKDKPKRENETERRKELKRQYKAAKPLMGVYKLTNLDNGNVFLGSSSNLKTIEHRHTIKLMLKNHKLWDLQEAWNKLGQRAVEFEILDKLEPKSDPLYDYSSDLDLLEELWAEKLQAAGVKFTRIMQIDKIRSNNG